MMEIGGYFGLEAFSGKEYYSDLIPVANGRSGLQYLLKGHGIKKLYIPFFLCDSVAQCCGEQGCQIEYYPIGRDLLPRFDKPLSPGEWLYLVNFYGQLTDLQILQYQQRFQRIILDNVQAFYQRPIPGVDTVYSCRKFFGVPDGGYVATKVRLGSLPKDTSAGRMAHVLGRFEATASDYYAAFQESEAAFRGMEMRQMSDLTHNLLRAIDYEAVRQKRNENYAILAQALGQSNALPLTAPDGPYCYPYYCENGLEVKKRLAEKKIYIPTLWPNCLSADWPVEQDLAANILPLPCDQRYEPSDIYQMINEIENS